MTRQAKPALASACVFLFWFKTSFGARTEKEVKKFFGSRSKVLKKPSKILFKRFLGKRWGILKVKEKALKTEYRAYKKVPSAIR